MTQALVEFVVVIDSLSHCHQSRRCFLDIRFAISQYNLIVTYSTVYSRDILGVQYFRVGDFCRMLVWNAVFSRFRIITPSVFCV